MLGIAVQKPRTYCLQNLQKWLRRRLANILSEWIDSETPERGIWEVKIENFSRGNSPQTPQRSVSLNANVAQVRVVPCVLFFF